MRELSDQDGIANFEAEDSDNDGIPDQVETNADLHGDGNPNFLDDDSDGDSISDLAEGAGDEDGDSRADYLDHEGEEVPGTNSDSAPASLRVGGGGVVDSLMLLLLLTQLPRRGVIYY